MKCTITWTRPAPAPAAKQQTPTAPAPAQHDAGKLVDPHSRVRSVLLTRERRLLRQLRRTAAERQLDQYEQGAFAVLSAAERDRNSIIYDRAGKYMWVPWNQIGPYLNRVG